MKLYYGLTRPNQLREMIYDVCNTLKSSTEDLKSTLILMLATSYQETHMGQLRDPTRYGAGTGVMQFDKMPYNDIKTRSTKYYGICLKEFNIDIFKMNYTELELSPLASVVMARVKYKLVSYSVPSWNDFDSVWNYYKKWYNSIEGKATREEFRISYKKALEEYEKI